MSQFEVGDEFPNLKLDGVDGEVQLRERWQDGPLVVMFMRHFGCAFCREQLIRVGRATEEFDAAGAQIVAIFQYPAAASHDFCRGRQVPFECLGDPERVAYAEVSLGRGGLRQLLGWRVAKRLPAAARMTGSLSGGAQGADMAQLPGTFVIDTGGRVRLAHYNESSADNPEVGAILEAVRAAG